MTMIGQARQPPSMPNFRYTHLTAENGMSRIKVTSLLNILIRCRAYLNIVAFR